MNVLEEIGPYIDEKGFVTIDKNPGPNSTGNGFLHLAFLCAVLKDTKQLMQIRLRVLDTVEESEVQDHLGGGLFHINPWKGAHDLTSWDEYLGIAALSRMCLFDFADAICTHGELHDWVFDNQKPSNSFITSRAFHGRFPGVIPFYKYCARRSLTPMEVIELSVTVLFSCLSDEADGWIKNYIRTQVLKDGNFVFKLVSKFWRWRAKKKFGTLGAMVKPYFGETHALSKLPWI